MLLRNFLNTLISLKLRPRSSAWLEYHALNVGVAGSNPVGAILLIAVRNTATK